jgi:calcineurin-like phosphoesterase family protein
MSTFFISDLHLGHENMAIRRGFSCADEMNETIIQRWNNVVNKHDKVFILGDVGFEKPTYYPLLNKLKGLKEVVLGNHDDSRHVLELLKYVNKVAGMIDYKKEYILTHCPIHPSQLDYRYSYNIHGHVHENSILKHPALADYLGELDPRYLNVSAEVIDYTPKTLEELLELNKLNKI